MGDLLFSFPACQALLKQHEGEEVHFYTSPYCRPLLPLMQYQSWIDEAIVAENYEMAHMGGGVQPREIHPSGGYRQVYQMGILGWPQQNMVDYYAKDLYGIEPESYRLDAPDKPEGFSDELLAQRPILLSCSTIVPKKWFDTIVETFSKVAPLIHLGWPKEKLYPQAVNTESPDLLNTAALFKHARLHIGSKGVNTCMSIAFPETPTVIILSVPHFPHNHNVHRPHTHYCITENYDEIHETIKGLLA